ncbi:SHOCT domain-containing protein [Nitrospira lenta]|uniref:Membrane protein-like n=1 Tax=Nitrospira lenta TaxID=1436998 RepID=A0A330L9B7_9BACT
MHEPMMGLWGWVGYVLMVVFWTLVILALVLWIKSWLEQKGFGSASREPESALEILKKRYARGEINKQEFEEKRKDLL